LVLHNEGDANRDPELADTLLDPQMVSWSGYLFYLSGIPYWIGNILITCRHAFGTVDEPWVKTTRAKQNVIKEAQFLLALHLLMLNLIFVFGYTSIWYLWYLPSFIGQVRHTAKIFLSFLGR
jgi:hypothetical protein